MSSSGTSITYVSSTRKVKKSTPSQNTTEEGPRQCSHLNRHSNQVSNWTQDFTKNGSEVSGSHNNQSCDHSHKNSEARTIPKRTNFFHIGITAGSRAVANYRNRQVRIVSPNQHISIVTPKRQIRIVSPTSDSVRSRGKEDSEVNRTVVVQPKQSVRIVKQNCQLREESRSTGVSYRFFRKASNVTRITKETRQSGSGSVVVRYPWGKINITRNGGQARNIVWSSDGRNSGDSDVKDVNGKTENTEEEDDRGTRSECKRVQGNVERLDVGQGGEVVNREGSALRRRVGRPQDGQRFVSVLYFHTTSCKHRGRKVKHGS